MWSIYRRAFSSLVTMPTTRENTGISGNAIKKTLNETSLFKVLLWYKNNKHRFCCRTDLCLKPLYITCYNSERQPLHQWLRGNNNNICLSLEWKLYLIHSKCSISNCWTFWINKGRHPASSLHYSPSFIKKPLIKSRKDWKGATGLLFVSQFWPHSPLCLPKGYFKDTLSLCIE